MDSLDAIKHQINLGDREGARLALRKLLTAEPDNTGAWALLAILLADPAEKAECYTQILRVNPADRHAAAWLEALNLEMRRSPADSMPVDRQPGDARDKESLSGVRDVDEPVEELDLAGPRDSTIGQPVDQEIGRDLSEDLARWPKTQPARPGFIDRIMGRRKRVQPETGSLASVLDDEASALQPGSLNPEDILRMAGGPLPPEERLKCPNCGAVVSRRDPRCPWCSASLQDAGEG